MCVLGTIYNVIHFFGTREAAQAIADANGGAAEGFSVVQNAYGQFIVEVRDEDGFFLGCL